MLSSLENECERRGIKLHYMTAREAFNVVKAAESGKDGDPESYRDFAIAKYRNMVAPLPTSPHAAEIGQSPDITVAD